MAETFETCRNIVKKVGTQFTCTQGNHACDSAVTSSQEQIGKEEPVSVAEIAGSLTSPASDVAAESSSEVVTTVVHGD